MRTSILALVLVGACATGELLPSPGEPRAAGQLAIVDEAGAPIAGARIDWTDASVPCDVTAPVPAAYVWTGALVTDARGRGTITHPGRHLVRVVAGELAALVRVDTAQPPPAIVLRPTATITLAPTCAGAACADLVAIGTIDAAGARCALRGEDRGGRIVLANLPRGELALTLVSAEGRADQAAGAVRTTVAADAIVAPALDRVGGPEVLRGRVLLPGDVPPGEPAYATHVAVRCGASVSRDVDVEPATGAFTVDALPARTCTLRATHDGDAHMEHTVTVVPGRDHDVVVQVDEVFDP